MAQVAVQKKLYPVEVGEAGVTNTQYPRGHIKRYGGLGLGPGVSDDTAALAAALVASGIVYCPTPPVSWVISAVNIGDNKRIVTDGFSTIFQQKSGQALGTRMLNIVGSNVKIGSFTAKGNIATDPDEQQHAVFIKGAVPIRNITLGSINGQDIRGDVVYIGGVGANTVRGVKAGNIYGNNIYRNVVSITGGENIQIDSIVGDSVGLMVLDVEPDPGSAPCRNIKIEYVRGSALGVIGNSVVKAERVEIGFLDMDSAFQTNSVPNYPIFQTFVALQGRNNNGLRIRHFKANNFRDHVFKYVYNAPSGDTYGRGIIFDFVDWTNCSTTEAVYHASVLMPQVTDFEIRAGSVTHYDVNKQIVLGDTGNPDLTGAKIHNVVCNGRIAKGVGRRSDFDRILINNAAFNTYAFVSCWGCSVKNSDITMGSLAGFCVKMRFSNVKAAVPTSVFDGANTDHFIENSTINAVYFGVGLYLRSYLNPIIFGTAASGFYLWVDAAGKFRTKNGAPANDTDGTVVGTQV